MYSPHNSKAIIEWIDGWTYTDLTISLLRAPEVLIKGFPVDRIVIQSYYVYFALVYCGGFSDMQSKTLIFLGMV